MPKAPTLQYLPCRIHNTILLHVLWLFSNFWLLANCLTGQITRIIKIKSHLPFALKTRTLRTWKSKNRCITKHIFLLTAYWSTVFYRETELLRERPLRHFPPSCLPRWSENSVLLFVLNYYSLHLISFNLESSIPYYSIVITFFAWTIYFSCCIEQLWCISQ